jgi:exodeoxyribonuclease VII large subunit
MSHIFRVRELTQALKDVVEGQFPFVWVRGQVSNLSRPGSGHIYFSLKDEEAVLSVVWFKSNQWLGGDGCVNPLTGEICEGPPLMLEEGKDVLCAGRLTVYPPRGTYQLVAELVQERGVGRLYQAFEAMKLDLQAKGYFDQDRKMVLPRHPQRVAVVTAPGGAAVRDFLCIASERGLSSQIRIHPALVQGDLAPAQIAQALEAINADGWAEVVVLIRGGGSLEDLWAFNTKRVADALYASRIPVLAGIGHEVDTTIADMVADRRAATPTHAAQILWPERRELLQMVDDLEIRLQARLKDCMQEMDRHIAALVKALGWLSPVRRMERLEERLKHDRERLCVSGSQMMRRKQDVLDSLVAALGRQYGPDRWAMLGGRVELLTMRLGEGGKRVLDTVENDLRMMKTRLESLDPEKPLARGYSLVRVERTGRFLRDPDDVAPDDRLEIRVHNGVVPAVVVKGKE